MTTYNAVEWSETWEVGAYGAPSVLDSTAPTVTNVTPANGSSLGAGDSVQFDVTDDGTFRKLIITAAHGGLREVVYEESAFCAGYSERSTVAAITGGYRFVLRRFDGWRSAPTIRVHAVDTAGNEST